MQNKLNKITEYLKNKYKPEVIILHGSRVFGKARENSDWDLYVFTKDNSGVGTEVFEDESLDIGIIKLPIPEESVIEIFGPNLRHAKILLDNTDKLGEKLVSKMQQIYSQGKKLTKREYEDRKNMAHRILERMKGTHDKPELIFLHTAHFYERVIRYWYELKGEWSRTIHEALDDIKERDSKFYSWLQVLASNNKSEEKLTTAEKIYDNLFK